MSGQTAVSAGRDASRSRVVAAGSVLGAILASSCCIVPLLLVTLGASGAWIGNLTVLEPYKPIFAGITFIFLGVGFWHVYLKPKKSCAADTYCATDNSTRITKFALWISALLVLLALTIDYWAPLFY